MTPPLDVRVLIAPDERAQALRRDALAGLSASPKSIPPTWFYDERGSDLFDEITKLEEYYPTRTERSILAAYGTEMVRLAGADTLVELGSGTSEKTRLLLDAMASAGSLARFVPFDVSEATLRVAAEEINRVYGVEVTAVVGDFHRHLGAIPHGGRRLFAFLGGTIGNLTPPERQRFLADLAATMDSGDHLLLGTDLEKDVGRLVAAYDDVAGVTAAFNRNVLVVLNEELGADFDPEQFVHVARWNASERWIEMWLRSRRRQRIRIDRLELVVSFAKDEEMLTEISAKFTPQRLADELDEAGFVLDATFTDDAGDFALTLAHPR